MTVTAGIFFISCSKKEVVQMQTQQTQQRQLIDTVSKDPVAKFIIYNPFGNTHAPATIGLNNLSSNATSYSWDFGDGTQSTDSFPTHLYSNSGTYSIQLIASNGAKKSKTTQIINILSPYTQISISGITIMVGIPAGQGARPGPGSIEILNSARNRIFSGSDSAKTQRQNWYGHFFDTNIPIYAAEAAADRKRIIDYFWTFDTVGITSTPLQSFWILYDVDLAKYSGSSGSSYSDSSTYNFQPSVLIGGTSSSDSYPQTVSVSHNQTTLTLNLQWQ